MRLQCPNCDAEYEVDASAIPFEGRDVQCSNCGHGWFQAHPDYETEYEVESALYDPPPPLPSAPDAAGAALPKRAIDPDAMRILREEVALEESKRAAEAPPSMPDAAMANNSRQGDYPLEAELDDMVAAEALHVDDTLPSESAQLTSLDSGDGASVAEINTQPQVQHFDELGDIEAALDATQFAEQSALGRDVPDYPPMPRTAPRRVARLKGLSDEGETAAGVNAPVYPSAPPKFEADPLASGGPVKAEQVKAGQNTGGQSNRRDWQPLDGAVFGADDLRAEMAAAPAVQRTGRRAGFYSAILAAMASLTGYVLGPDLAQAVPELAAPVASYIDAINAARDFLQQTVAQVLGNIQ